MIQRREITSKTVTIAKINIEKVYGVIRAFLLSRHLEEAPT